MLCLGLISFSIAKNFDNKGSLSETIYLPDTDHIQLTMEEDPYRDKIFSFGDIKLTDDKVILQDIRIDIYSTTDSLFSLDKISESRGKTLTLARQNAENANIDMDVRGNELVLGSNLFIDRSKPWRGQEIDINLYVPIGKEININKVAGNHIGSVKLAEKNGRRYWHYLKPGTYLMTEEGLVRRDSSF